jgi:CubicO group peptidase (beta-lactamase class C family)
MLHKGVWNGEQLVPEWWIDLATKPSQDLNPAYGYTWWVGNPNTGGPWSGGYEGTFALSGHRTNYCCIYPALDLVIARVGSGPSMPEYSALNATIAAVIE